MAKNAKSCVKKSKKVCQKKQKKFVIKKWGKNAQKCVSFWKNQKYVQKICQMNGKYQTPFPTTM